MTHSFELHVGNKKEFENEIKNYFQNFEFEGWLKYSFEVNVVGHSEVKKITFVTGDMKAGFRKIDRFGHSVPVGEFDTLSSIDLVKRINEIVG